MKNSIRAITAISIIIVCVAVTVVIGSAYIWNPFQTPTPLTKKEMENDFKKNKDNILLVTNYLIDSGYNDICIHKYKFDGINIPNAKTGDTMFASGYGNVAIGNQQVIDAIDILLHQKGYGVITRDGNIICYQRSTIFRSYSSGIAYSIDNSEPEWWEMLTKLEPLSEQSGWYYYEEDNNEWLRKNDLLEKQ